MAFSSVRRTMPLAIPSHWVMILLIFLVFHSSKGQIGKNLSSSLDPLFLLSPSSVDSNLDASILNATNSSWIRKKRLLEINAETKKVIMFFNKKEELIEENYAALESQGKPGVFYEFPPIDNSDPNGSTRQRSIIYTEDFIVRLQEKYDYTTCNAYLDSVPDLQNRYFTYDEDLVNIGNEGDSEYIGIKSEIEARKQRANATMTQRYRLYNEPCDVEQEFYFWQDMFVIAENDTIPVPKKASASGPSGPAPPPPKPGEPVNKDAYDYVQFEPKELMFKWNEVWNRYKTKGVCNQRLLLQCTTDDRLVKPKENTTCQCRKSGVGLSSVAYRKPVRVILPDVPDGYTVQYYEDEEENKHGEVIPHYGKYVHKQKCVLTASFPYTTYYIPMINPCDFFLPMIGMCQGECVRNATCRSVTAKEKEETKEELGEKTLIQRIKAEKTHEFYHNRCVCDKKKRCKKAQDFSVFNQGISFRSGRIFGALCNLLVQIWIGLKIY